MATPMGSSARRERLRSLAEADQLDEEIIFAAEARKRTRQAERQALSTSPILDITINQPSKYSHAVLIPGLTFEQPSRRFTLSFFVFASTGTIQIVMVWLYNVPIVVGNRMILSSPIAAVSTVLSVSPKSSQPIQFGRGAAE